MAISELWTYRDIRTDVDLDGYDVEATDGSIGTVDEATRDAGSSYLVVDTGPWIFGKRVVLPAGVIDRIDTTERRVFVSKRRDEIKSAPEYDSETGVTQGYREQLGSHYEPQARTGRRSQARSSTRRSSSGRSGSNRSSQSRSRASSTRGRSQKGPSTRSRSSARRSSGSSSDGPTRDELYTEAKRLGVPGRSKMNKRGLAQAIARRRGRSQSSGSRSQASGKRRGQSSSSRSARRGTATPIEVQAFLDGVSYPKKRGDLLREAERSGAGQDVRATIERLPDRRFGSPTEVSEAIGKTS